MRIAIGVAAALTVTTAASADVLWDQSDYDVDVSAFVNQEFGPPNEAFDAYLVTDVVTGAGGWAVQSVTGYWTNMNGGWNAGITMGRLNVIPKTGDLPSNAFDPRNGAMVGITLDFGAGDTIAVNADGLDIFLEPNTEYWIGLTPIADFGQFGQEFHRGAPITGVDTAFRNPGGGFGFGPDWQTTAVLNESWIGLYDAAILVEGVPGPGTLAAFGMLALGRRRRRR